MPPSQFKRAREAARQLGIAWFLALFLFFGLMVSIHPDSPHVLDVSVTSRVQSVSSLHKLPEKFAYNFAGAEFAAALEHGDIGWIAFKIVSWFGDYPLFGLLICAGMYLLGRDRRGAIVMLCIGLLGGLSHFPVKLLVARARPHAEIALIMTKPPGHSFPSGHTTYYTIIFCFLFAWARRRLRPSLARTLIMTVSLLQVPLVGAARIYLGAHYVSDVAGGYLWGYLWVRLGLLFLSERRRESIVEVAVRESRSAAVEPLLNDKSQQPTDSEHVASTQSPVGTIAAVTDAQPTRMVTRAAAAAAAVRSKAASAGKRISPS